MSVLPRTEKFGVGVPPKETALAPEKLAPVIVTKLPPTVEPKGGLTELTLGAAV